MSNESSYGEGREEMYRLLKHVIERQKELSKAMTEAMSPAIKVSKAMTEAMSPVIKQIQEQHAKLIATMGPFIDYCKKKGEGE